MRMNIAETIGEEAFNVIYTELKKTKLIYSTKYYYFPFCIHK